MKRVLVCGSRLFDTTDDEDVMIAAFAEHDLGASRRDVLLIHGACRGADLMAARIGQDRGWWVVSCPPNWKLGKKAGPQRNELMFQTFKPELTLAFPVGDSKGTRHAIKCAERLVTCKLEVYESIEQP